jgi:hypothetical protein
VALVVIVGMVEEGGAVPGGGYLPDSIGVGVLTRLVTRELVDEVVARAGRAERRRRLLPARVVVYFVLAMALFYADPYEEVMRKLVQGLSWLGIWRGDWHVPTASALAQARKRLGSGPLRELYERVAVPCAGLSAAGAWMGGRRLMSLDGVELDVADSPANAAWFGYSHKKTGIGAFPKLLVMALAECGTHAVTAIEAGRDGDSEQALARALAGAGGNLEPGMLVMAGRGLPSYELAAAIAGTGADFCFRVSASWNLPVLRDFPDRSWLSYITVPGAKQNARHQLAAGRIAVTSLPGMHVRVVQYQVPGRGTRTAPQTFTLITSILDPADMTSVDLAAAYHERWEIEITFDEIETSQRGPAVILKSRSPDLVLQELYGLLITHYAIRELMAQAADQAGLDPDRLSFTRTLNMVRRQVTSQAAFSPSDPDPRDP